jgi:glycerol-3-phosphate cytidylyltransferase
MKVGFTCGTFDLLHPGHIAMLKDCKAQCDKLVVGLHTDPTIDRPDTKNKPIQTTFERYLQLEAVKYVDQIIPYDTEADLSNLIGVQDIDIRFVGDDHINDQKTGQLVCDHRGVDIVFNERNHDWSSTELRERINARNKPTIR